MCETNQKFRGLIFFGLQIVFWFINYCKPSTYNIINWWYYDYLTLWCLVIIPNSVSLSSQNDSWKCLFSKFEFTSFLAIWTSKSSIHEFLTLGLVIDWLGVYFWKTVGPPEITFYVFGRPKEKVIKSEYLHTQGIYNFNFHFIQCKMIVCFDFIDS